MTNRERFMNLLLYKPIDRLPAVHFGYWDDLLFEWAEQGKISKELAVGNLFGKEQKEEAKILNEMLGWDFGFCDQHYSAKRHLFPPFESKILETLPDGSQRVQNENGLIERIVPGVTSIPAEDDYQLKDREAFETLYRPKMQFTPERVDYEFFKNFNETRPWDIPVGLNIGSILGDIRNMTSVLGMSYLMYDEDEELFADIIDTYADMQDQCVEAVLATGAKFDYAHFWEDICYKNGPLIAPDLFEELCAKHYRKRVDICRKYGIEIFSLDSDGVVDKLLPIWVENGVNTMFPIEIGVWGDQFVASREKFGKTLRGIGGVNKIVLREDKAAVDAEIERLKPIIALGGFVPMPDHLLLPGTKFELVQRYTDKIKNMKV